MILNIFLTAVIFLIVFTVVMQMVDSRYASDKVAFMLVTGFILSGATAALSALALVWTR